MARLGQIAVHRLGSGPKPIIALHGFSRNGSIFAPLARRLEQSHTIYAIDLPFHGQTEWRAERYDPQDIASVILASVAARSISRARFLGHSLGGRLLLKVLGQGLLPADLVEDLTLVAPDGLRGNYTGRLDKLPSGLVKALAWAGGRRDALLKLAELLHRRGLFDRYTLHYLQHHLRDERTQRMLLGSFRTLPKFRLGKNEQQQLADLNSIITLVGTHDPLMNLKAVQRWFEPLPQASVQQYQGHHSLPVEVLANLLR